jgi:hypothetical protein
MVVTGGVPVYKYLSLKFITHGVDTVRICINIAIWYIIPDSSHTCSGPAVAEFCPSKMAVICQQDYHNGVQSHQSPTRAWVDRFVSSRLMPSLLLWLISLLTVSTSSRGKNKTNATSCSLQQVICRWQNPKLTRKGTGHGHFGSALELARGTGQNRAPVTKRVSHELPNPLESHVASRIHPKPSNDSSSRPRRAFDTIIYANQLTETHQLCFAVTKSCLSTGWVLCAVHN